MRHGLLIPLLCLFCWITLQGCTAHHSLSVPKEARAMQRVGKSFHSLNLDQCQPVPITGKMVSKVDHFLMIVDPSASMTEGFTTSNPCLTCHERFGDSTHAASHVATHGGGEATAKEQGSAGSSCTECHQDFLYTKFDFAKEISRCFNNTIPEIHFVGSLRTFGSPVYTAATYGPLPFDRSQFDLALQKVIDPDGASPLDQTVINATKDWFAAEGRMAVLVISDGKGMGEEEVLAAKGLVGRYGDRVCLYTLQIGSDENGREVLREMAGAGHCGAALNGDTLRSQAKMGEFVRQVFLRPAGAPVDSDGDGVADGKDDCPGTKAGTAVDERGCWKLTIMAGVLFDFDRHTLKPEGLASLKKVADYLKQNPLLRLEIGGHTDNFGTQAYNERLSQQRAQAGREYLLSQGIAKERVSLAWYSFAKPVASNETAAGRALNRRIEFKFRKPN